MNNLCKTLDPFLISFEVQIMVYNGVYVALACFLSFFFAVVSKSKEKRTLVHDQ